MMPRNYININTKSLNNFNHLCSSINKIIFKEIKADLKN